MGRSLQTRLSLIRPSTSRTVRNNQEKMINENQSSRQFSEGETVNVRDYRLSGEKWIPGTIESKTGPLSYRVNVGNGAVWRRHTDQIIKGKLPIPELVVDLPPKLPIPITPKAPETVPIQPPSDVATPPPLLENPVAVSSGKTVSAPSPRRNPARRRKAPSRLDL
ncbi:uncharacterized protein [Argopecten irradians]|uniref:uncharacterized protein n=1 Tax=Argopecten irradians TaxID=31199 RepID=UPI00371FFCD7